MSDPRFVHLRVHSEYSIVDGIVRLDDVVEAAAEDGQGALALTDLANLFGLVRFYKEARGKGVKPIVGCDVWITNPDDRDKPSRLLLLVKNQRGYLQPVRTAVARRGSTNQYRGRAEIEAGWLEIAALARSGLIALSGAHFGDIGLALDNGNDEAAERSARRWAQVFPGAFLYRVAARRTAGRRAVRAAGGRARGAAEVAGGRHASDAVHDAGRLHRARGARLHFRRRHSGQSAPRRSASRPSSTSRTQDEMAALFADIPSALANSVEIAKRCNLTLELGKPKLPLFPTPDGMSLDDYLVHAVEGRASKSV